MFLMIHYKFSLINQDVYKRQEQDTCVVSILDPRTAKKGRYRSDVLEALPKCQMAERIEEVENFIRSRKVERYYS